MGGMIKFKASGSVCIFYGNFVIGVQCWFGVISRAVVVEEKLMAQEVFGYIFY